MYGLLYLSSEPISLGEIAEQLGISKGNASLNIRHMERWGLIHPISKKGDRKDYYEVETDFWRIFRGILNERDKKEIEHTLNAIKSIFDSVSSQENTEQNPESLLYQERLELMLEFGNAAYQMLQAFLAMDKFLINSMQPPVSERYLYRRTEIEE